MQLMHMGAYFDPGMEFELPEYLTHLPKENAEQMFDAPFSGEGVRIIKSHIFCYQENIEYLRKNWPECPIVLVHRDSDSCLGWWVRCGHFNITYPKYEEYYKDLKTMAKIIDKQNSELEDMSYRYKAARVYNNSRLALILEIQQPPDEYRHSYVTNDIEVSVIC